MKRVVITGMGAVTPIGNTVNEFTNALMAGQSGAAPITKFNAAKFKTRIACEVKGFDALQYMDKAGQRKTDLYVQYALAAAVQAMQQGSINVETIDLTRAGVIVGTADGGSSSYLQQVMAFAHGDGQPRFSPQFIAMMMANSAPAAISMRYGFLAMNYATVASCASSSIAIADAVNQLRWGRADVMLAGGAEANIIATALGGFQSMRALSTNNENAATASRPFDAARDGFVMGEGAAMFLLETEAHALERGATILAEITGTGITSDAYHIAAPHPQGAGAARAMQLALQDAGLQPTDIQYMQAHATSTPVGDLAEMAAIQQVFGNAPAHLKITAGKAATGHLLGGAGALGLLATIQALQLQQVPPIINTTTLDAAIPATMPIVTGSRAIPFAITNALCNSFGFGGHNAAIVCRRYVG
jgi:3-oxoacyl-[acyl-carrier-protein] synthase II